MGINNNMAYTNNNPYLYNPYQYNPYQNNTYSNLNMYPNFNQNYAPNFNTL